MPVKAANIEYQDIQKIFSYIPNLPLIETELFLQGDHWQGQRGWIGWRPATTTPTALQDWQFIQGGFTPKNVIRGMVKRLQGAILGREPDWEITAVSEETDLLPAPPPDPAPIDPNNPNPQPIAPPTAPEPTPLELQFKEYDEIVKRWWTDKKVHKTLKKFVANKGAYGKAALRIYIPAGYVKQASDGSYALNVDNATDLAEVLSRIYVDVPHWSTVMDAPDMDYGTPFTALELRKDEISNEKYYELCYVDEDGKTYLRQVSQGSTQATNQSVSVDLAGNLMTYIDGEFHEALISEPVKKQQKQLNHANTMEGYALANINFPPTYFTNAVTDVEEQDEKTGKIVKKRAGLQAGPGRWVNLIGILVGKSDGSDDYKDPKITFQPTGKPQDFAAVAQNKARDMHEEAGMLYVFLADNPYPSGTSRIEAMTDYLILLVDYKTICDAVGSWLLETVMRLAFNFTGQTDLNDQFNVLFSTKITIGRISTEDKKVMLAEVQEGLRSRRNYMITTEVTDDPMGELKIIKVEEALFPPPAPPTSPFLNPAGQLNDPNTRIRTGRIADSAPDAASSAGV